MKNSKFFLLIISLIFFLNLIFFNISFATLYIVKDQEGNNICITNQESLISKYKSLGYIISIVQGSDSAKEAPEPQPVTKPSPEKEVEPQVKELDNQLKADIVFIDSTNRPSSSGNYIYVEGVLKNKGKGIAHYVKVKVQSLDKYGKLVSIDDGYADPSTLLPNQEATYQIMVNQNSKIAKFDKTVYWE